MRTVRETAQTGTPRGTLIAAAAVATLTSAIALALGAGQARAFHVGCGQTVTGTVVLHQNLSSCPGDGLIVGGPNVTIDLNGFTIDGIGNGAGIANTSGDHPGLTVVDGTIQQFFHGISTDGAGGRFDRLTLRNNDDNGLQVFGDLADRNNVTRSTVTGNGGNGIVFISGDENVADLNTVSGNDDDGIQVQSLSDGNRITRNQSNANRGTTSSNGISVSINSARNTLDLNTTNNNLDDGIEVDNASTTITRNTARNNRDWGIDAVPGVRHSGNRASGNGQPAQCLNVTCTA